MVLIPLVQYKRFELMDEARQKALNFLQADTGPEAIKEVKELLDV